MTRESCFTQRHWYRHSKSLERQLKSATPELPMCLLLGSQKVSIRHLGTEEETVLLCQSIICSPQACVCGLVVWLTVQLFLHVMTFLCMAYGLEQWYGRYIVGWMLQGPWWSRFLTSHVAEIIVFGDTLVAAADTQLSLCCNRCHQSF